jgi:hypothetical protein
MMEDSGRRHAMMVLITSITARTWASEYSETAPFSPRSSAGFFWRSKISTLNNQKTQRYTYFEMPPKQKIENRKNLRHEELREYVAFPTSFEGDEVRDGVGILPDIHIRPTQWVVPHILTPEPHVEEFEVGFCRRLLVAENVKMSQTPV